MCLLVVTRGTRYSLRVIAKDQAPSASVEFSTIDGFGWDAEASTQGGKIRITNNNRTVTSSGGSAASLGNVGFSRGRVTISLVVEVRDGSRVAACLSPPSLKGEGGGGGGRKNPWL